MFWYLDWRLQSGGGSYWYFTWKLSSVHIVSKQPGRTPTLSITGDLKKNAFWGVCHKILPLPSLGNLLGNFKESSPVFGTLSQTWMLSMNLNLPGRCHFCATSSLRRASRQRHESGNFYFQIFVLIVILSALRLRRSEHMFFTFTTIMIMINIHIMISTMFTSWSS